MEKEYIKTKAASCAVTTSKTGEYQISIGFDCQKTWYGSLKEGKPREIAINALKVLDFNGSIKDLIDGKGLDFEKEVQITVEDNTWEGKTTRRVTWINNLGKEVVSTASLQDIMQTSIAADFAAAFTSSPKIDNKNIPF